MAKRRAMSDGSTARVEAVYREAWEQKFPGVADVKYSISRDRGIIKRLVTQLGEDETCRLLRLYFAVLDTDPVIVRWSSEVGLRNFLHHLQRLQTRDIRRPLHERTAHNLEEARKAVGG